jgi:hypothetical protein
MRNVRQVRPQYRAKFRVILAAPKIGCDPGFRAGLAQDVLDFRTAVDIDDGQNDATKRMPSDFSPPARRLTAGRTSPSVTDAGRTSDATTKRAPGCSRAVCRKASPSVWSVTKPISRHFANNAAGTSNAIFISISPVF